MNGICNMDSPDVTSNNFERSNSYISSTSTIDTLILTSSESLLDIVLIYAILIINDKYVRWEILKYDTTYSDLIMLLKNKYNIGKCLIEIGNKYILMTDDHIIDLCKSSYDLEVFVTTSNKNYVLEKDTT